MAEFILDHTSGVSYPEQWKRHLQKLEYVNDIRGAIEKSAAAREEETRALQEEVRQSGQQIGEAVGVAALAQIATARRNATDIVGTLELTSDRISANIDALGRSMDYRLDALIYQHSVGNLLLSDIRQLLRIPDFQKERLHYTEAGLKHFHNALIDPTFYREALDALLQAEEREKTDYVVLYTIGMIRGYAERLPDELRDIVDLSAAENYFQRAARYAAIESHPEAAQLTSILSLGASERLADKRSNPKRFAADAHMHAGFACYRQGKFVEAAEHAARGVSVDPEHQLVRFNECKFLAAAGNVDAGVRKLEAVIRSDRYYAEATRRDVDLVTKQPVLVLLNRLRHEAAQRLAAEISAINQRQVPFFGAGGNEADQIMSLQEAARDGKYQTLMAALDAVPKARDAMAVWDRTTEAIAELQALVQPDAPIASNLKLAAAELPVTRRLAYVTDLHNALRAPSDDRVNPRGFAEEVSAAHKLLQSAQTACIVAEGSVTNFRQVLDDLRSVMGNRYDSIAYRTFVGSPSRYEEHLRAPRELIASAEREIARLSYSSIAAARENSERALTECQGLATAIKEHIPRVDRDRAEIMRTWNAKKQAAVLTGLWAVPAMLVISFFSVGVVFFIAFVLLEIFGMLPSEVSQRVFFIAVSLVIGLTAAAVIIRRKLE